MATAKTTKAAKPATEVKTVEQLREDLTKLQAELLEAQKSHRAGELVNPHILTTKRRDVARVHTAINIANRSAIKEEN